MIQIVLHQPEIPPNTGSIARLCAATRTPLHLIEPLGFSLEDRYLRRAGLDYWPHVNLSRWPDYASFRQAQPLARPVLASAGNLGPKGEAYQDFKFSSDDVIVLGTESKGLPLELLEAAEHLVRIPIWGEVRSLNLANAAGILLYEALRQTGQLEGR